MSSVTVSHAPENYPCPFCLLAAGTLNEHVWSRESDIIYRDEHVMALIAAGQWPNNQGHVLVVPTEHFENLYDLPDDLGARIHALSRRVALAMKSAYNCHGVSTRQHNEPAGNQDVWHYHLHVFPRYEGDDLYAPPRAHAAGGAREVRGAASRSAHAVKPFYNGSMKLIFEVHEAEEGGFWARALGESIFTQAETWEELRQGVLEAVQTHYKRDSERPGLVPLQFVLKKVTARRG